MKPVTLRGITWNHSRALPPLAACAQRFEELHPGVEVSWRKRTLHQFGHSALKPLCRRYDLLIIDHPMLGDAHRDGLLLELDGILPGELLEELEQNSVGASFASYRYEGRLYALPVDAAAPAASYRPDLMARAGRQLPRTWADLLSLASSGLVVMPGFHADVFLNLMALCVSRGSAVPYSDSELFQSGIAGAALEQFRELALRLPSCVWDLNPTALYELMAASDNYAYCPFAFTYSNYSRRDFAKNLLLFTNPVMLDEATPVRTILGGTGIAISRSCPHPELAAEFAAFVSAAKQQRSIYALSGGQPGHRSAWLDSTLNSITHGFFENTLDCMDRAHVRPRYPGYIALQGSAGPLVVDYLRHGGATAPVLDRIDALYRRSRRKL